MTRSDSQSIRATLLKEPSVHFLLVAALVFAIYGLSQSRQGQVLEIDPAALEARLAAAEINRGEALTPAERQMLTDAYIEEQILVREALAMGLDNDARIHDLLAQKMRHVLSGGLIQPSEQELADFYAANRDRYHVPATLSADELVFDDPDTLPETVQTLLDQGAGAEAMLALAEGNSGPLRNAIHLDLANIFSAQFADQVFAATAGEWVGPFVSNRGQHWLRVTEREPARVPSLAEIRNRVRLDWIAAEEESRLQQEIDRLRDEYTIVSVGESH